MGRRRKSLPSEPVVARIESLTHDGRGVTHIDGKAVFVHGALAGEQVRFRYLRRKRSYDEALVEAVREPAAERVAPPCAHFGLCGGCALQHLAPDAQVAAKQATLLENLRRIGRVEPAEVLPPLRGPQIGYRRKARLGVRYVEKKGRVLVGFRERSSALLAELERCAVLHPSVGERLAELGGLIGRLTVRAQIAQIEVAVGDEATALVFRNLQPLPSEDEARLRDYAQATGLQIYLQPGGPDTAYALAPPDARLSYRLPEFELEIGFLPTDFTQVNADINRQMVSRAVALLDVQAGERVLDLYCGLGNFTLALARRGAEVVGVEGEPGLVARARANAAANGLADRVTYFAADLAAPQTDAPWRTGPYDKVLLDPPRTGALEMLGTVAALKPQRIVYVSCGPATLARDAGVLVHEHGYRLVHAGVMDMFPHTAHVESIAVFERKGAAR